MNLLRRTFLTATAGTALLLSGSLAAVAEPITLKIADSFPQGHVIYDTVEKVLIPALEEGGLIKVQYFPANQLGKMEDVIEAVRGGVADIGYVAPGIVAGKMPATNMLSLPGLFGSGEHLAEVFMKMVDGTLKQEYDKLGIKIIMASGTPPYQVFTSKKVTTPEEIKGLKLRGGGGDADDFLRAMGVSIVNMPASQMYESLQRGVIDGALYLQATASANHLEEVTKFATEGAPLMSLLALYFIDQKKWESFSPEIQAVIATAGEKAAVAMGREYDRRNTENASVFTDAGGTITKLSPEEVEMWRASYADAKDKFVEKIKSRGFDYVEEVRTELEGLTSVQN